MHKNTKNVEQLLLNGYSLDDAMMLTNYSIEDKTMLENKFKHLLIHLKYKQLNKDIPKPQDNIEINIL